MPVKYCETRLVIILTGVPVPTITWRRNRIAVEAQVDTSEPGVVRSTLTLQPLKRSDWPMTFSCSASNSEHSRPLEQAFDVDMDRKSEPAGPADASQLGCSYRFFDGRVVSEPVLLSCAAAPAGCARLMARHSRPLRRSISASLA